MLHECLSGVEKFCLIILNSKIESKWFHKVWNKSSLKICADGAANRLYSFDSSLTPDIIHGDLDSISDESNRYFEVKVIFSSFLGR